MDAHGRPTQQNLFGIVQGGLDPALRAISIRVPPCTRCLRRAAAAAYMWPALQASAKASSRHQQEPPHSLHRAQELMMRMLPRTSASDSCLATLWVGWQAGSPRPTSSGAVAQAAGWQGFCLPTGAARLQIGLPVLGTARRP